MRGMHTQVRGAQRAPDKRDPKRPTPRYILIKMPKIGDKERILKAAGERQLTCKGAPTRVSADVSTDALQGGGIGMKSSKQGPQPRLLLPAKRPLESKADESSPGREELMEVTASKSVLQGAFKGLL